MIGDKVVGWILEGLDLGGKALHQVPFRPFTLRMTSGKEYAVEHHDFVSASRSYRRLYISTNEDDRVDVLDTLMIESLHHSQAPVSNGDGQAG